MPTFNMTVVQVAPKSATSKAGKPYRLVEIAYKNNNFGKLEEAKINEYSPLFKQVADLQVGASYDVTKEKDDNGYFQWKSVVSSAGGAPLPNATSAKTNAVPASGAQATRSTYETPEERAKKQVLIVKQSSVAQAVALHTAGAKTTPPLEAVLKTAQQLTDWVLDDKPMSLSELTDIPNDLDVQVD